LPSKQEALGSNLTITKKKKEEKKKADWQSNTCDLSTGPKQEPGIGLGIGPCPSAQSQVSGCTF
jgi:hypothetical protein